MIKRRLSSLSTALSLALFAWLLAQVAASALSPPPQATPWGVLSPEASAPVAP